MGIVYDSFEPDGQEKSKPLVLPDGRPNGSLFSRQKRKIADACEWLRLHQTKDTKALIFCLTSPGYTSLANTPKFISRFIDNMRTNYGMGDYVWVREMTKAGYPHFHFVAHWHPYKYFLDKTEIDVLGREVAKVPIITNLSRYWSRQFGSDSPNSIRLGSYLKKKRVGFYLTNEKHAWYLTKYLGKSIGEGSMDYLAEAGFPQVKYKKTVRSFGMSEQVGLLSEPDLFESTYVNNGQSTITTDAHGQPVEVFYSERVWKAVEKELTTHKAMNVLEVPDSSLSEYQWRWTGHGETYIGLDKKRTQKARTTSERGQ
jgi:hypothetical protein